jgi:hypothetical protein
MPPRRRPGPAKGTPLRRSLKRSLHSVEAALSVHRSAQSHSVISVAPSEPLLPRACRLYSEETVDFHDLGRFDIVCQYCSAYHWIQERISGSSQLNPQFQECCKQGRIHLPYNDPAPSLLHDLFTQHHPGINDSGTDEAQI